MAAAAAVYAPAPAPLISKQSFPAYSLPPSPPLSDDDEQLQKVADVAPEKNGSDIFTNLEFERPLGETELSYFLPSRDDGVNDMYALFTPSGSSPDIILAPLQVPPCRPLRSCRPLHPRPHPRRLGPLSSPPSPARDHPSHGTRRIRLCSFRLCTPS